MEFDGSLIGQPNEGGRLVGQDVTDGAVPDTGRVRAHPRRRVRRDVFLIEVMAADPVEETDHRQRAVFQVGEQHRGHLAQYSIRWAFV